MSGWNPAGSAAPSPTRRAGPCCRSPASCGCSAWASASPCSSSASSSSACSGTWRLATLYPSNRARIAALLVYAAIPLVPGVISTGRLTALVAYAAVPWFVQLLRVAVGIGTADPASAADDLADGIIGLAVRERVRRTALLADRHRPRRGAGAGRARRRRRRLRRPRAHHARRRRRLADRGVVHRPRPGRLGRWPGCSTCRGRRRGRGTTSSPRSSPGRPAAASSTWRRWRSGRPGSRCSRWPSTSRCSSPSPSAGRGG